MEVNFIGRPGYTTILGAKRRPMRCEEYIELEEKRFKHIYNGITKLKELEDEKLGIPGLASKQGGEMINFRLIKESQLIKEGAPAMTYSKN